MRNRLDALSRIGRLQALMHDLGRSRLHSLERERAGLTEDLKAVFETLESGRARLWPAGGAGRAALRALQRKLDQLVHEHDAARLSALAQGTRAKLAEHAARSGGPRPSRQKERKELVELIERAIARARRKLDVRLEADAGSSLSRNDGDHGLQSPHRRRRRGPQRRRSVPREPLPPSGSRACGFEHCGADFAADLKRAAGAVAAPLANAGDARSRLAEVPGRTGQGRRSQDAIRSDDAELVRRRIAAEGEQRLRPGDGGRHVAVDARRAGVAADRQVRRARPRPPPVRHP